MFVQFFTVQHRRFESVVVCVFENIRDSESLNDGVIDESDGESDVDCGRRWQNDFYRDRLAQRQPQNLGTQPKDKHAALQVRL